ncbi:methyltransferase domain-containing protein [Streptomyces sp. NPDC093094]|uniref:methyltransferase domain-containing protein n=1 Tax=Streptomyces sp. NPDC093094 TaxID=3366026 RepID=UPI0037FDF42E
MNKNQRSWAMNRRFSSPFTRPSGVLGRLAGRLMLRTNMHDQQDVLEVLDIQPGDRVLEVGYGPGGLLRLLADRTEAALIQGVDPSPEMCRAAAETIRGVKHADRVLLRRGTADGTGLDDQSVDWAVSVNNVAIWHNLEAGLRELHRVVRTGGTVLIAWHGGFSPGRTARGLQMTQEQLGRIHHQLESLFADVTRSQLRSLDVFTAVRH